MTYFQRDIVKVKAKLPSGEIQTHPFLIISNESVNKHEKKRFYIGVMLTHSKEKDRFSFPLYNSMIDGNLGNENCQIRLHIIHSFTELDISPDMTVYIGKMKAINFREVLQQIKDYVVSPD